MTILRSDHFPKKCWAKGLLKNVHRDTHVAQHKLLDTATHKNWRQIQSLDVCKRSRELRFELRRASPVLQTRDSLLVVLWAT